MEKEITSPMEIISFINKVECKMNAKSINIENIDFWPFLRIQLYYELSLRILNNSPRRLNKVGYITRVFKAFLSQFKRVKKTKSILLVSDGISYVDYLDKSYDRFCDPLIEILEEKSKSWSKWDLTGSLSSNDFYFVAKKVNSFLDFITMKSKISKYKIDSNQEIQIKELIDYINDSTNLIRLDLKNILDKIHCIVLMVDWYKKILVRSDTKIVLLVSYYSDRGMALIKACKDLGIKTADIQHGIQGNLHAAYGNWLNNEATDYNTIPDSFLVWSEFEKENIKNSIVIGNVFESMWYGKNKMIDHYDKIVTSYSSKLGSPNNILFTLQYGIKYDNSVFELLHRTQNEFNWLIRFHPVMENDDKSNFIKNLKLFNVNNYEIDQSTSLPLYAIIRNVGLHVTHSSSTVLEAANFKVSSLIIDPFGAEYFENVLSDKIRFENQIQNQINAINELFQPSYSESRILKENKSPSNFYNYIISKLC